jgi:transposase
VPAAYSSDLRERVVHTIGEGTSRRGAAGFFKVSVSTAIRWTKRLTTTSSCAPLPSGGDHRSKALEQHRDWLLALVGEEPDATLAEIQTRLSETHGLKKSASRLWRFFRRHDVTLKKPCTPPNRTGRTSKRHVRPGEKPGVAGPGTSGLHRRDRNRHEHDAASRALGGRAAPDRESAARSSENHDFRCGAEERPHHRAACDRPPP